MSSLALMKFFNVVDNQRPFREDFSTVLFSASKFYGISATMPVATLGVNGKRLRISQNSDSHQEALTDVHSGFVTVDSWRGSNFSNTVDSSRVPDIIGITRGNMDSQVNAGGWTNLSNYA